jgi:AcrR family transcriptional regulator
MTYSSTPVGKVEVRHALIQAAAHCFAAKGIKKVSVREIASQAQVNHGLIHRHFGSKQELTQAVFLMLSQNVDQRLQDLPEDLEIQELLPHIFGETKGGGLHWRILTHALVEGIPLDWIQSNFPVFERLQKACFSHISMYLSKSKSDNALSSKAKSPNTLSTEMIWTQATIQSILIFATGLGFLVFKPFLQAACESQQQEWESLRPMLMQAFVRYAQSNHAPFL